MYPFTVISVSGEIGDALGEQKWIGHYEERRDALMAFVTILKARGEMNDDTEITRIFDRLLMNGDCYRVESGSQDDIYFVRRCEVQKTFNASVLPKDVQDLMGNKGFYEKMGMS